MSALEICGCGLPFRRVASIRDAQVEKGYRISRRSRGAFSQKLAAKRGALCKFYGQATKGAWWMPWQKKAMKDVASCEKLRPAASRRYQPEMSEWGNPRW